MQSGVGLRGPTLFPGTMPMDPLPTEDEIEALIRHKQRLIETIMPYGPSAVKRSLELELLALQNLLNTIHSPK